jgi:hypothetical protein
MAESTENWKKYNSYNRGSSRIDPRLAVVMNYKYYKQLVNSGEATKAERGAYSEMKRNYDEMKITAPSQYESYTKLIDDNTKKYDQSMNESQPSEANVADSSFNRLLRANQYKYDIPGQTTSDEWIGRQEQIAELTGGLGQDYDYSMMNGRAENGHGSDRGKLPWHPTFSTQSAFSTAQDPGGVWGRDGAYDSFTPTQKQDTEYFRKYMMSEEPDVKVIR